MGSMSTNGSITSIPGLLCGHFTDTRRPTGCTVILAPDGAVAGVDVRGAAPGTRETELLSPLNSVEKVHAVLLAGGSAFGLDAAGGVMRWLDERGIGVQVGTARVPIVPAAILFDLMMGDASIRPDAHAGYAACQAANAGPVAEGSVGAGTGAAVGKLFGLARGMKGGIGSAAITVHGVTVAALMAVNATGDVVDPSDGRLVAGARSADGQTMIGASQSILGGEWPDHLPIGGSTTLGVLATDALLDKVAANRLARAAHDGLARTIHPVHTPADGDTVFALATGTRGTALDLTVLSILAAEVTARAVLRAVRCAQPVSGPGVPDLPCAAAFASRTP
jgi:L-aminopeptidase/D-esterase-like protein